MPTRTLTATQAGPVAIDLALLGAGGSITVRSDRTRKHAEITIRTADENGPAADAVRDAELHWDARGTLVARVKGRGAGSSITQTISGIRGGSIVQNVSNNYGSMVAVSAGDLNLAGGTLQFNSGSVHVRRDHSPIEITAVVPENSPVAARTDTADIQIDGAVGPVAAHTESGEVRVPGAAERVTASTQSGHIRIDNAPHIIAETTAGDILLGRTDVVDASTVAGCIAIRDFGGTAKLTSVSGDIRAHAGAGGDLDANTVSGHIAVTASQAALDGGLTIRPHTVSGRISVPPHHRPAAGVRRRAS